jgi:hypothetical protein
MIPLPPVQARRYYNHENAKEKTRGDSAKMKKWRAEREQVRELVREKEREKDIY